MKPLRSLFSPLAAALLVPAVGLGACGAHTREMSPVYATLRTGNFVRALSELEKSDAAKRQRDRVVYLMDRGMLLQLAGKFMESNKALEEADRLAEELYTTSLSKQAASLVTNETVLDYEGEDFERVLINFYKAVNYFRMGDEDDAMVECRQVDNKLNVYNSKYEKKNVYREDAFVRYLIGIIFESQGEVNDAFISYRKALKIYQTDYMKNYGVAVPPSLPEDLIRTGEALGFTDEVERFRKQFPQVHAMPLKDRKKMGEVVFLFANGMAPHKTEYFIESIVPADGYHLKIAFPRFEKTPPEVDHVVVAEDGQVYPTALAEPIDAIAVKNLEDRIGRIQAKAIARAVTKYLASRGTREAGKRTGGALGGVLSLAGTAMEVAGNVTEHADTRSWGTLPAEIELARFALPPGRHRLGVQLVYKGQLNPVRVSFAASEVGGPAFDQALFLMIFWEAWVRTMSRAGGFNYPKFVALVQQAYWKALVEGVFDSARFQAALLEAFRASGVSTLDSARFETLYRDALQRATGAGLEAGQFDVEVKPGKTVFLDFRSFD